MLARGGSMAASFSRRALVLSTGALLALAGCDLLEFPQNPSLRFKLPPLTYELSTSDPNWKAPPPFFNQAVSCTSEAACCPPPGTPPGVEIPECKQATFVC